MLWEDYWRDLWLQPDGKMLIFFIMIGRIIQGIGGAAGTAPLAMALVGDLYQDKMR